MSDDTPLAVPPRVAAQMLSVSEPTLRKLGIPVVRIGARAVRYRVADLDDWLRARATGAYECDESN